MKYFGTTTNNNDLVNKSYIDNSGGNNSTSYTELESVLSIPVDRKSVIINIPKPDNPSTTNVSQRLAFASDMSVGSELYLYISSEASTATITIPNAIGNYPVVYDGSYSRTVESNQIQITSSIYEGDNSPQLVALSTVTLHVFFTGTMYYIDRMYTT